MRTPEFESGTFPTSRGRSNQLSYARANFVYKIERPAVALCKGGLNTIIPKADTLFYMDKWKPTEQTNLVGVGLTILVIIALSLFIDISSLKIWVERAGVWGPLVFMLLKISSIVIAPLSGSYLYPLVGLLFGFWPGILYVALADFLGYTIAFYISRLLGRKIVLKLISDKEEGVINRIVNHISETKGFVQVCLIFFALPDVLSYAAGLSRISYIKFISILWPFFTAVTAILVLFGSILEPRSESLLIGLAIPIAGAVAMLIGGSFFLRAVRK